MSNSETDSRLTEGTATPVGEDRTSGDSPVAILEGRCIERTLRRIQNMPEEALLAVRKQSEELIGQVLSVYAAEIAPGEVGEGGSARAGEQAVEGLGPTGLLYGRIQSGKTVAMITFTALAIDNGFRVIVVLTTNFVELVRQTKDRFDDLGRALVHASTEPDAWEKDVDHIRKKVGDRGLVIVCAKDPRHLENVLDLLKRIDAAGYPALILDDEADQASLDTNVRKRSRSATPDEVPATAIHLRIADIRKYLRHHLFLQVTATPYALLLQRVNSPLRPKFTFLLEPGFEYTGGEHFFSKEHIGAESEDGQPTPPLVYVDERESAEIQAGPSEAPAGLERAITYFLVAAATQALNDPDVLGKSQNFLCHTSHKKAEHDKLHGLIVEFTSKLEDELDPLEGRAKALVNWAYAELKRTMPDLPDLDEIIEDILDRLPRRKIRIVNSEGKSGEEVRGAPNFIIGGNIVGRGLTIPNLLVTYYLRKPKISQMDTMLQHARMFGYRGKLMPFTRVFLPRSLALRFWGIHEAEDELRSLLPDIKALEAVPVQVIGELRATRYGVLDTGSIVTIRSGKHLYPTTPPWDLPSRKTNAIRSLLEDALGPMSLDSRTAATTPKEVGLDSLEELLNLFNIPDWDNKALIAILRSCAGERAKGFLRFRTMERRAHKGGQLLTGALSGKEVEDSRRETLPTLWVLRQLRKEEEWGDHQFWYPTIVFPLSMPNQVYNDSELE